MPEPTRWRPRFESDAPKVDSPEFDLYEAGFVPATYLDEWDGHVWRLDSDGDYESREVAHA